MPKFKHEDKVRVVEGQYAGQTGTIWGKPTSIGAVLMAPISEGEDISGEEKVTFLYQVDLDESDDLVRLMESSIAFA